MRQQSLALRIALCLGIAGWWAAAWAQDCAAALESADNSFRRRQYQDAIRALDSCLSSSDTTQKLQAHILLARIHFAARQNDRSEAVLARLWQILPGWLPGEEEYPPDFCFFVRQIYEKRQTTQATQPPQSSAAVAKAGQEVSTPLPTPSPPAKSELILPTTDVLSWFVINAGLGTLWDSGSEIDVRNPVLAHVRLGFEFAELEFRRQEIINKSELGQVEMTTGAVKLRLPEGLLGDGSPALTGIFHVALPINNRDDTEERSVSLAKSFRSFALLASQKGHLLQWALGLSASSVSICKRDAALRDAENDSLCLAKAPGYYAQSKRNLLLPLLVLRARITPYNQAIVAFYPVPRYGKPAEVFNNPKEELTVRPALQVGMNVIPWRHLNLHIGSVWRFGRRLKDDVSENEFRIALGATLGLSLSEVFHELQHSRR